MEAVRLVVPQAIDVKVPQLPLNNWTLAPEVLKFAPIAERLIDRLFENVVVLILYQTSSSGVPVAQSIGIPELALANHTVPALFVVPDVNAIAPGQSSFEGGPVI